VHVEGSQVNNALEIQLGTVTAGLSLTIEVKTQFVHSQVILYLGRQAIMNLCGTRAE
jgi:hypothetical protein